MRLSLPRLCRLSPVLPWRRWLGKALIASLVLPGLAAAAPENLEPIKLRKTWQSSSSLEPIQLKKPISLTSGGLSSGLPDWTPIAPAHTQEEIIPTFIATEAPAQLVPVATAPERHEVQTGAVSESPVTEQAAPLVLHESAEDTPPLAVTEDKPGFNQRIQSLADKPGRRIPSVESSVKVVLPANLVRVMVSEESIRDDDKTINAIIDIADQYADVPQLLLEVRGLAPMTATTQDRQLAYQNALLVMSGLVSAGIPYHRIAAFVTLLDAAPGSVDIIRTR